MKDGSCIRRRAGHAIHVWACDFIADRTHDGRPLKMLTIVDEFTRECLAIEVGRHMKSIDVLHVLSDPFVERGTPEYVRSDNGPEFTAALIRQWLETIEVGPLFIEPGSPWENGYVESFNCSSMGSGTGWCEHCWSDRVNPLICIGLTPKSRGAGRRAASPGARGWWSWTCGWPINNLRTTLEVVRPSGAGQCLQEKTLHALCRV